MANTIMDGGIIQSRIMRDKSILPQQIMLYRDFVRTVFLGA
jgi:TetR/AcrR family transcriptional regulator, transcriptional repressor for nem operon